MSSDGQSQPKRGTVLHSSLGGKGRSLKRKQQPTVFNGFGASSSMSTSSDLDVTCPICFQLIEAAYVTECGHSFCYSCLMTSIQKINRCPKCNATINSNKIFPNLSLNNIVANRKRSMKKKLEGSQSSLMGNVSELLESSEVGKRASYEEVSSLINMLQKKKQCLLLESEIGQAHLTLEFLQQIKESKEEKLLGLQKELAVIQKDIKKVSEKSSELEQKISTFQNSPISSTSSAATSWTTTAATSSAASSSAATSSAAISSAATSSSSVFLDETGSAVRQRLSIHASELHDFYFSMRGQALLEAEREDDSSLNDFTAALSKFMKYKSFRQLATLNYTSDMYNMYSIVSSIEFDKDSDFFAIAGVTKKIKVYDYKQVVTDVVDTHYPITEMCCESKISCIAWNPYHKNELISSDYEGLVSMWDPFSGKRLQIFQEHEKRCWCVDYNRLNPHLFASGSDDSKVKIWSTRSSKSVLNIESLANVCCVKFNPASTYNLAFGAADHCVHYYDLRQPREALLTFKGHLKAVSYAKFVNSEEIVSASTDSQLKLWNVKQGPNCVRTFQGHVNEKNFVGLASESEYVACGSEDNSLCIYYKGLTQVLHKYKFNTVRSAWQRDAAKEDDTSEFVSAVSWMHDSGVIIVANSQGIVKVLELI